MKKETITRIKLTASNGMTLTNGTDFGKEIFLADTDAPDNWYEITDSEAEERMAAQQEMEV